MKINSILLPILIIFSVVFIYICDGNTVCDIKRSTKNTPSIGKKAYSNLNIDEENPSWCKKTIISSPVKMGVLHLAENMPSVSKKKYREFKHKEVTLVEDGFLLKFFNILHLKENRNNSKKPGKYGELGPYQIRKSFWIDGCKQLKVSINSPEWCYETNVWSDVKCRTIILAYFEKYNVPRTIDDMCGAFNSGNRWTKKWNLTIGYRNGFKALWFEEYGEKID